MEKLQISYSIGLCSLWILNTCLSARADDFDRQKIAKKSANVRSLMQSIGRETGRVSEKPPALNRHFAPAWRG
jgi:hypothetical protein